MLAAAAAGLGKEILTQQLLQQAVLAAAARAAAALHPASMELPEPLIPEAAAAAADIAHPTAPAALVGLGLSSSVTLTLMLTQRQQQVRRHLQIRAGTKSTNLRDRGASRSNGKLRATQRKLNRH
jgi:hypothetical protein